MNKKNLIRFDWAIKRLLRNKANYGILEGFLSELLEEDIKIEAILESETNKDNPFDKFNKVDLLVKNVKGELIIIEVQNDREHDFLLRMLYGVSKILIEHMNQGMEYMEIKKIISVNIIFFDLGQGDDYVYHGTTNFEGIHTHHLLELSEKQKKVFKNDSIAKIYPEFYIIKVNQFDEVAHNTLDEWIYFFKTDDIKDTFKAKGLKQAKEALDIFKLPPAEKLEYERWIENERYARSMIILNYKDGKMDGIAEGKLDEKTEIARKLLKEGLDSVFISKITDLSIEEIEKMSSQNPTTR